MQLKEKIISLIGNPDKELRNLGYGIILGKLDTSCVIYWYYTIYKHKSITFEETENSRLVRDKILELTRNIKEYRDGLDLDSAAPDHMYAFDFIQVKFINIDVDSIDEFLMYRTKQLFKQLAIKVETVVVNEVKSKLKIFNGHTE
jgi:hypothetical protein